MEKNNNYFAEMKEQFKLGKEGEQEENPDLREKISQGVKALRIALNLSCTQFAEELSVSRMKLYEVEKMAESVTKEFAFHVYYATQKIQQNQYLDEFVKSESEELQNYVDIFIRDDKSGCNPIKYNSR